MDDLPLSAPHTDVCLGCKSPFITLCIVNVLVCKGASACQCTLRTVHLDKILHDINVLLIIKTLNIKITDAATTKKYELLI